MAPVAQPALREPHSGPPILRIQWRPSRICAAPACCMEGGLVGVLMSRERCGCSAYTACTVPCRFVTLLRLRASRAISYRSLRRFILTGQPLSALYASF